MNRRGLRFLVGLTVVAGLFGALFLQPIALTSAAEPYPIRPVELIHGYAAGGSTDQVARVFVHLAPQFLGQPIAVVSKPGAGAALGAIYVSTARPDGYTLYIGGDGPYYIQPLVRKLPYTPFSFRPICRLAAIQTGIVVRSDAPWKTGTEWLEYVRQSSEAVPIAMNGGPNPSYVGLALVLRAAKIDYAKVKYIVYKGDGDAIPALLGGHVKVMIGNTSAMRSQIESGQFRVLGNFQGTRSPVMPNVPTWKEQGYDVDYFASYILGVPKDTPDHVVKVLDEVCRKTASTKEFASMIERITHEVNYASAAEMEKIIKEDFEKTRVLLEELGLRHKE